MKHKLNLLEDDIKVLFFKYVSTSVLGMITVSLYILFDTIFIGRGIGKEGLTALNISLPIYNIIYGTGMLIGGGGATAMSISRGSGDEKSAVKFFKSSVTLGVIMGAFYSITGTLFLDKIALALGATKDMLPLVKEYLGVILLFSPFFLMVQNLTALVRNDRGYKRAMFSAIAGGLTNLVFDYIFIYPLNMGMRGAAIATVMSAMISVSILSLHFTGENHLKLGVTALDLKVVRRITAIGLAGFIIELSSGIAIFLFNKELLNSIGELGVAAYSIIANCSIMLVAIITGIAQGIQPIVSINHGAMKNKRALSARNLGLASGVITGILFLLLGLWKPEVIASAFTSETGEMIAMTVEGIKRYFIAFPLMGITIVMGAYFQAIAKNNYSNTISLFRGVIFIGILLKLLPLAFGVNGIWLTVPFSELLSLGLIMAVLVLERRSFFGKVLGQKAEAI
ncbi:MATE family efflux transporter [Clostridium polynesiense]|uniref:MATE family efflux transporter n=1 Tax=Clostridium polynesiense TaxID=1325933 RepID=UPI000693C5B1|nr:MATE family efflux transporter [Clostridium polynesiense]